jgi:hypothetical protein
MKLHIITGAPNTRKSSVIRALTGVRDSRAFDIQFEHGIVKTFVFLTSRNEIRYRNQPNAVSPEELVTFLNNLDSTIEAVIIPLRSTNPVNGVFAETYIDFLNNNGFEIGTVVMFNTTVILPRNIEGELLISNSAIPSNLTASRVRKIWGIV